MNFNQKDIMANNITTKINDFSQNIRRIPATSFPLEIDVLSRQLVASVNRVNYFQLIQSRPIDVKLIYAELSGDFPLGDSRQPIYKSLRPFDLVS